MGSAHLWRCPKPSLVSPPGASDGPRAVRYERWSVVELPANVQSVVALLAVRERAQLRTALSTTLWIDATEERAAANLRTALWRLRLRHLPVHALEALCPRLAAERLAEVVDAGHAAVAAEPLRESAQRDLIAAHLAQRDFGEARRQYELRRGILPDGLGVELSFPRRGGRVGCGDHAARAEGVWACSWSMGPSMSQ